MTPVRIVVATLALHAALLAACSGCSKDEPKSTQDDASAAASAVATPAVVAQPAASSSVAVAAVPAGAFNRFFPKEGEGGTKRVFSPDKVGFAEAKLQKDGKDVAVLSISDADKLVYAKAKFEGTTEKLAGFPVMQVGDNQTSLLVKERYQVKVTSQTLDHDARKALLETFDLTGLAAR